MRTLKDNGLLKTQAFIDGNYVGSGDTPVTDPASGAVIAHVPNLGAEAATTAVEASSRAFRPWAAKTAKERSATLRRWFELIVAARTDLATILTSEQGKPLAEALGEIDYAASYVEFYAEEAKRVAGEILPSHRADARILVQRQPLGVIAAITPWNFPAAMITRKVAPALAAGCTVVVKPAPETPLTALALAELARRAGFPAGTVKRVALELGGNAPFIVFDAADVDATVEGAMASKFRNSGQTCVCTNRINVQSAVHDVFVAKLMERVKQLRVGCGFDDGVVQSPLISERAVAKVEAHIEDALGKGAEIATSGKRHALGGTFFEPTVITSAASDMLLAQDETFGPLAPVFRFETEAEVLQAANATETGLAAYFFTRDSARVFRMMERLEFGMVGVNTGLISTDPAPFGGVKESGNSREGSHHGILEFTELKYACIGGIDAEG